MTTMVSFKVKKKNGNSIQSTGMPPALAIEMIAHSCAPAEKQEVIEILTKQLAESGGAP